MFFYWEEGILADWIFDEMIVNRSPEIREKQSNEEKGSNQIIMTIGGT